MKFVTKFRRKNLNESYFTKGFPYIPVHVGSVSRAMQVFVTSVFTNLHADSILIYFVNNFISNVTFITDFDWRYTLPQGPINIFHCTDIESIFRTYKIPGTTEISGVFQIPNSFFNITFIGSVAIKTTLTPFLNLSTQIFSNFTLENLIHKIP